MSRAIPLGPLFFGLTGLGLIGLSGLLGVSPGPETPRAPAALAEETAPTEHEVALLTYHDPVRARGFVDIILGQSPFVSDRSAYSRSALQTPRPVEPELNPQFVGVFGSGTAISALVVWEPGQPAQSHGIGDETPWGVLTSVTSSRLVFEGEKGRKELELF